MERSMIWIEAEETGWACSNCQWTYPVPTLLTGHEAKNAYDRLAAGKFREHQCQAQAGFSPTPQVTKSEASPNTAFVERARTLIKRGYKPKVAVDLVLHEIRSEAEIERRNDPMIMEKANADAQDFLQRVQKGLL